MKARAWIVIAGLAGGGAGCLSSSDEGGIEAGTRLVRADVRVADGTGGTQRRAMQGVAVYAAAECAGGAIRVGDATPDGAVAACAIFGEPFDPAEPSSELGLVAPCDTSINLVIQILDSSGGRTPGELVAVIGFASGNGDEVTTLIPREVGSALAPACRDTELLATNLIDLGEIRVPSVGSDVPPVVIVGGPEGGANPLATVDTDGDETPNLVDGDDDGDAILDADDDDDDGDGAADDAQRFDVSWWL